MSTVQAAIATSIADITDTTCDLAPPTEALLEDLRDAHTGSSTGVSSWVHHSGSVRPAKSRNVSPSSWCVS